MAKTEIVAIVRGGKLVPMELFSEDMAQYEDGQMVQVFIDVAKPEKLRSSLQNRSLHKYYKNISNALNAAGCDQRGIMAEIGRGAPIPWSEFSIKALWKSIQLARHGKDSTTKMTSAEYSKEHQIFDLMISEASGGVSCPLPSKESASYE